MIISLNGEKTEVKNDIFLQELLIKKVSEGKKVAVAINGEFIPRSAYSSTVVNEADQLDILAAVQGG